MRWTTDDLSGAFIQSSEHTDRGLRQVGEGLQGGAELLQFHLAHRHHDLPTAAAVPHYLDVPTPVGLVGWRPILVGVEVVSAHHPLHLHDAGLAACGQGHQGFPNRSSRPHTLDVRDDPKGNGNGKVGNVS
jgi:hypothetical protein